VYTNIIGFYLPKKIPLMLFSTNIYMPPSKQLLRLFSKILFIQAFFSIPILNNIYPISGYIFFFSLDYNVYFRGNEKIKVRVEKNLCRKNTGQTFNIIFFFGKKNIEKSFVIVCFSFLLFLQLLLFLLFIVGREKMKTLKPHFF
jgi:hypothetical protein